MLRNLILCAAILCLAFGFASLAVSHLFQGVLSGAALPNAYRSASLDRQAHDSSASIEVFGVPLTVTSDRAQVQLAGVTIPLLQRAWHGWSLVILALVVIGTMAFTRGKVSNDSGRFGRTKVDEKGLVL